MSLTVPTSGNIGGASASVQVATPDTGAVISEFGNKMAELGGKWKDAQTDFRTRSDQLSMTSDLANARLEAEQAGDPVASGQIWDAKKQEIFAKYLPVDANGNSTLDQKQAEALQLTFQGLDGQHTFALAEKSVNWTRSQASANWLKSRDKITTEAVTADPETFGALLQLGEDEINAQEAQGLMDPDTAERNRQALRQDVYKGRAFAQLEADPEGLIADLDAGKFDAGGAELVGSMRISAGQEIARRQAEAEKADKVAVKARDDALKTRFGEIGSIAKKGATAVDEDYLNSPEVKAAVEANPELAKPYGEAQAAIALRGEIPGIHQMSPPQLLAEIAKEKSSGKVHEYQTERLATLQGWYDQAVTKWNTDKVATAKEVGLPVPDLPAFDPADPGSFAKGIAGRISFDSALKDQKYGSGQGILSNEDRTALKDVLAPEADAATKTALAKAVAEGSRGQPDAVVKAMGGDTVFLRATRILSTTQDVALAGAILRGQQKIATKTVVLPSEKTMTLTFDDITGGIYDNDPTLKAEVMNAARALYADGAGGLDPDQGPGGVSVLGVGWSTDPAAVSLFTDAVKRVSGATADGQGDLTVGGVQPINGTFVSLPPGVAVADVEDAMQRIEDGLGIARHFNKDGSQRPVLGAALEGSFAAMRGDIEGFGAAEQRAQGDGTVGTFAPLLAASIYGGAPDLGPNPDERFSTLSLRAVKSSKGQNSGIYEFVYMDDGRAYTIAQTDGKAYRFRLADLIRQSARPNPADALLGGNGQ